jgi:hypothetical protein
MDKRALKRIPTEIAIEYYLWNPLVWKKLYNGTINNLSEKGMHIRTKTVLFPLDSLLEISIPSEGGVISLPAKVSNIVWRNVLPDNTCDSMGVELSNPPPEYLDLVARLRSDA